MKQNFLSRLLKKSASYYVTVVNQQAPYNWSVNSGQNVTNEALISNFETIPEMFTITNYIADKVSNIPVKVVKPSGKPATNSELNKLIANPNEYQSWNELIKLFFSYYEPLGNAYFYGIKPEGMGLVTKLYCLPVEKTQIILARNKALPAWMNEVAGYEVNIGNQIYSLPADMVFHEKYVTLRYDDGSWVYGISKYMPGDKINRELKAIHDAKTSIIEQRGAVGFITNESEQPDEAQSKVVKEKLKSSTGYGLLGDQDKVIVTTEKLRWQQMALGIQELQIIENAKLSFAQMCQLNGFDPVIFSTEGSTFANKQEAVKDMMNKVIKPKVDNFYKNLSIFLSGGYGGDQIVPDWSQVEELQEDKKAMTELLSKQIECMIITPKEAREQLYPDQAGEESPPDTYFRRTSLVPADQPEPTTPNTIDPEMVRQLAEQNGGDNGN